MSPIWNQFLEEKGLYYNSILAGSQVYGFYFDKYKSKRKALLEYKGFDSSKKIIKIVDKIIKLEKEFDDEIQKLLKE